jgi:Tfp pilus assembly pilus retraction ATPase PilT
MNSLRECINEAFKKNAMALTLVPGKAAQYKIGKKWVALQGIWTAQDLKREILSFLSEDQKADFFKTGILEGVLFENGRRIGFTVSQSHQGLCGYFHWIHSAAVDFIDWGFPLSMIESIKRGQGLSVIAGPKDSGKTSSLMAIAKEVSERAQLSIALFSDRDELTDDNTTPFFISYDASMLLTMSSFSLGSDLILLDSERLEVQLKALELVDQGQNVLMTLPSLNIELALQRLSELYQGRVDKVGQVIQWICSVKLLPGLESNYQPLFELLIATPQIRQALFQNDWSAIEREMKTTGDITTMRTQNQALLQAILKRKIEFKTGFEESPNPTELDSWLRKVGF